MSKNTGGPAFPCSVCDAESTIRQGNQRLCDRHYRFGQMRAHAKRHGKTVPSREKLEAITPQDMRCPDCGTQMNWRAFQGQSTVATLQHYRDGTHALVCRSCNTRHAFMPGDEYRLTPADHKLCPKCDNVKPASEFTKDNNRSGELKRKSYCRACADKSVKHWKERNRERYNEYQRAYRARRKAEGSPITRGR